MGLLGGLSVKIAANGIKNLYKNMKEGFEFIEHNTVVAGIPAEKDAVHAPSGLMNSELLYIHCNGSPARNIPPRNVLKAAEAEGASKEAKKMIKTGMRKAVLGKVDEARGQYDMAGMQMASAIQAQFGKIPPPNAPSTIARKGSSATLIDTGALRDAITYVVRDDRD